MQYILKTLTVKPLIAIIFCNNFAILHIGGLLDTINVTKSSLPNFEDYISEIASIWSTHWLTNMGEKHQQLETRIKSLLNCKNIVLFSNGHLALESMLRIFNIKGEVITSPYTFASTAHAITRVGATAVYCDIKPDDLTIDENKIESLITERTEAILPIHVYGNICNNDVLERIAQKYNLKLLYDGAHSFAESKNGINTANMGDATMFSFHATKVFHTIEGGAICFNDDSLRDKFLLDKNFGIPNAEEVLYAGGNAKMNEFQAAMGICNLNILDSNIQKRKILAEQYYKGFKTDKIQLFVPQGNVISNYGYMPVLFESNQIRDMVFNHLTSKNIHARKYFYPICNEFTCYKNTASTTPVALDASRKVLCLPLYPDLDIDDVDRIILTVQECLNA